MAEMKMSFSESFYEAEVRCEYTVEPEMKKVWAVELDLLNELLRVCKKHKIKVMATAGTLLGAVRHKGFIPWDNDIDMMVSRKDYERLCKIAEKEFSYPYFFQTEYTDPGSLRGHAQLRNSSTAGILKEEEKVPFNQGIFIDIFPLDAVVEDEVKWKRQGKRAEYCKNMARRLYVYTDGYEAVTHTLVRNFIHTFAMMLNRIYSYDQWYARFERICARYNGMETKMVSCLSFLFWKKSLWKVRSDCEVPVELDFEMLKIPVPCHYEQALRQEFGDWKKMVKNTSEHGGIIFDTERSYLEYVNGSRK